MIDALADHDVIGHNKLCKNNNRSKQHPSVHLHVKVLQDRAESKWDITSRDSLGQDKRSMSVLLHDTLTWIFPWRNTLWIRLWQLWFRTILLIGSDHRMTFDLMSLNIMVVFCWVWNFLLVLNNEMILAVGKLFHEWRRVKTFRWWFGMRMTGIANAFFSSFSFANFNQLWRFTDERGEKMFDDVMKLQVSTTFPDDAPLTDGDLLRSDLFSWRRWWWWSYFKFPLPSGAPPSLF